MDLIVQTANVNIAKNNVKCGLYHFNVSNRTGSFVSMAPEAFDIFVKNV